MRVLNLLLALPAITAGCVSPFFATAQPATPQAAQFISAGDIAAAVSPPTDSAVAKQMNSNANTVIWSIKREKSGDVELHRTWNDVIIAKEGTVTVLVGAKVEGNRQIKPNEWLGGKIIGGREFTLKPGDILFIPAGLGHQMTLPGKEPFTYLVIKTEAHATAND
jgi:mannose-6-phosphate isomerase-like protein (cupin superfamily)